MIVSIYLHDDILHILQHFGTLEEVINKIVDASVAGIFDVGEVDKCPPTNTAKKYYVNIINSEYLEEREIRGKRSSKISIRRMIYHFVTNELYYDLGWKSKSKEAVIDVKNTKYNFILAKVLTELTTLYKLSNMYEKEILNNIIPQFKLLKRNM